MTSEGLGEMFEGDSADTCDVKFLLVSMGGRAKGLACADPEASSDPADMFYIIVCLSPRHDVLLKCKLMFLYNRICDTV